MEEDAVISAKEAEEEKKRAKELQAKYVRKEERGIVGDISDTIIRMTLLWSSA